MGASPVVALAFVPDVLQRALNGRFHLCARLRLAVCPAHYLHIERNAARRQPCTRIQKLYSHSTIGSRLLDGVGNFPIEQSCAQILNH